MRYIAIIFFCTMLTTCAAQAGKKEDKEMLRRLENLQQTIDAQDQLIQEQATSLEAQEANVARLLDLVERLLVQPIDETEIHCQLICEE
jgi:hypothetical protein